jgi:nitroreductase
MSATLLPKNPWKVQETAFPWRDTASQKLKFLLNYAVLAPSIHNTQPWSFRILDDEVECYADVTRAMRILDPRQRQLVMSCGSALFNLRLAIAHYRHFPIVHTFPEQDKPHLIARVRLIFPGEPDLEDHRLFMAIKKRRTYRGAFQSRSISDEALSALRRAAEREHARLDVIADTEQKTRLAGLVAEGVAVQRDDAALREELAQWTRGDGETRPDGVPAFARARRPAVVGEGTSDWGGEAIPFDVAEVTEAPALVVLSAVGENRVGWLNAGQALSRVLLTATVHSLAASFLNQAVEVPPLRERLAQLVGQPHPQAVLRLGYPIGHALEPVPRQSVDEKIVTHDPNGSRTSM